MLHNGSPDTADQMPSPTRRVAHRVAVQGTVDDRWLAELGARSVERGGATNTLTVVADQAALRGALCRLGCACVPWRDANGTPVAVVWIPEAPTEEGDTR